jgi:rare lipoprotein A
MKAFVFKGFAALLGFAALASPASAEFAAEWSQSRFAASVERAAPAPRATQRAARAATSNQTVQIDDGSRPQRRSATQTARVSTPVTSSGNSMSGIASYYWQPQPVASGGRFNPEALTAAHKTLPFGTRVRVTRQDNGRSVDVTINDRGPYIAGRIIDLSRRAAQDIGMTGQGLARVNVSIIGR